MYLNHRSRNKLLIKQQAPVRPVRTRHVLPRRNRTYNAVNPYGFKDAALQQRTREYSMQVEWCYDTMARVSTNEESKTP